MGGGREWSPLIRILLFIRCHPSRGEYDSEWGDAANRRLPFVSFSSFGVIVREGDMTANGGRTRMVTSHSYPPLHSVSSFAGRV
jgi:hypothetical protein